MATGLAEHVQAKCLLLNHFSQRYKPKSDNQSKPVEKKQKKEPVEEEEEEEEITTDFLLDQAKQNTTRPVFIADDFFTYTVSLPK